jgi:hypothetical protein
LKSSAQQVANPFWGIGINGTVISAQNAASNYVRFLDPSQWELLDFDDIYAMDWRSNVFRDTALYTPHAETHYIRCDGAAGAQTLSKM